MIICCIANVWQGIWLIQNLSFAIELTLYIIPAIAYLLQIKHPTQEKKMRWAYTNLIETLFAYWIGFFVTYLILVFHFADGTGEVCYFQLDY